MAGLNIGTIRTAIKTVLDLSSIARDVAVYAYAPGPDPDVVPGYPAVLIGHGNAGVDYMLTFGSRGLTQMDLEIEVRTASGDGGMSAERVLDDLLSAGTGTTSSIFDALNTDPTFGGVCTSVVTKVSPPRPIRPAGPGTPVMFWAATFTLTINQPRA